MQKKYKRILIVSLLTITALPETVNIFVFQKEWWQNPTISKDYLEIVITFWRSMYPLAYYMIGCYLAEYGWKIRRATCGLLLIAVIILNGSYSFLRSCGLEFATGTWQGYGALNIVVQSVLAFQFISTTKTQNYSKGVRKCLKTVSDLCFGAYLVSQMPEEYFYPLFRAAIPSVGYRMNYYPLMIGLVFVCSMVLSAGLNLMYEGLHRGVVYLKEK